MIVNERIQYLKKYRTRGDIKTVAEHFCLKYNTCRDIINGLSNSPNCEKVLNFLEKMIADRIKRQESIRTKYQSKLNNI